MSIGFTYEDENNQLVEISLQNGDIVLDERWNGANEPTEFPVGVENTVTDHVLVKPDEAEVTVRFSARPIVPTPSFTEGAVGSFGPIERNGISLVGFEFNQEFDRLQAVDAELDRLRRSAQIVTYRGSHRERDNMVIKDYNASVSAGDGNTLTAVLALKQIRRASLELIELAPPRPAQRRGRRRRNKGQREPKDISSLEARDPGSFLANILDI